MPADDPVAPPVPSADASTDRSGSSDAATTSDDVTPPVLTSITVTPTTLSPGSSLTVSFAHTEDVDLRFANFRFEHTETGQYLWVAGVPVNDTVQRELPGWLYDGGFRLARVSLQDAAYNTATYTPDGVTGTPNPPASTDHDFDFSTIGFDVTGSTTTPDDHLLTALELVQPSAHLGDVGTVAYTVRDDAVPLSQVQVSYDTGGTWAHTWQSYGAGPSGQVESRSLVTGPHTLSSVSVHDARLIGYTFLRDGTWVGGGANGVHGLDFSALDFTVKPGLPTVEVRRLPQGASLTIHTDADVRTGLTGYRVTVEPGARTLTVPVGTTDRATHTVSGLTNGVAHRVSVTPLSQWGDGRTLTTTVTPMLSTNIFSPGDITGDRRADVVAHLQRGVVSSEDMLTQPVYVYPGNGSGGFGRKFVAAQPWEYLERVVPGGDSNGDGRADWFGEDEGALARYALDGFRSPIGHGWASMRFVDGGVDFSGDGRTDIIGVAPTGEMFLYRGDGHDRVTSRTRIGVGWQTMLAVFSPGDWNGDRRADVVAVDSAGDLWLYRGNGLGGFMGSRLKIGRGWAGFGAIAPMRDFNGDGRMDLGAVTMSGDLYLYGGNGSGGFIAPRKIGVGWHAFF